MIPNKSFSIRYQEMSDLTRNREPLLSWEDVHIGETYHIPPFLCYDRRDITVKDKTENSITGRVVENGIITENYTLFKCELSAKYLVKKQEKLPF